MYTLYQVVKVLMLIFIPLYAGKTTITFNFDKAAGPYWIQFEMKDGLTCLVAFTMFLLMLLIDLKYIETFHIQFYKTF